MNNEKPKRKRKKKKAHFRNFNNFQNTKRMEGEYAIGKRLSESSLEALKINKIKLA